MSDAEDLPPRELIIDARRAPGDSADGSGSTMAPIVLTVIAAAGAAKLVSPLAGLGCLGAGVVLALVLRKPNAGRFVLRREDEDLVVTRERAKEPLARVPLASIFTVTLDRETRQGSRGASASERVKIVLERDGSEPIAFPDERITPIEGQEWQARVRVFLRKNGWLPHDER